MPVSLAEAKNNALTDYDPFVIDEFRKESVILDSLIFDDAVNPAGGGATLTYGYRRQSTQPTAATRAINSEYTEQSVTSTQVNTTLAVMGGSFQVDRVSANVGPAASSLVTWQLGQKIKATRTKFQDLVVNGDTGTDANGFDGLNKALTASSTEFKNTVVTDWTALNTAELRLSALDALDDFLSLLDGAPTLLIGNRYVLGKVRSIIRGSGMYVQSPVEGLLGVGGRPIVRESYGGVTFSDPGEVAGSSTLIIPNVTRTIGVSTPGLTDLYAVRIGLDGFHGVTTVGGQLVQTWLPDFTKAGAVKAGEVELGPVGVALKATKAAAVFRNIKVV